MCSRFTADLVRKLWTLIYLMPVTRLRSTTSLPRPKHPQTLLALTAYAMAFVRKTHLNFARCIAKLAKRDLDQKLRDESCWALTYFPQVITMPIIVKPNRFVL